MKPYADICPYQSHVVFFVAVYLVFLLSFCYCYIINPTSLKVNLPHDFAKYKVNLLRWWMKIDWMLGHAKLFFL